MYVMINGRNLPLKRFVKDIISGSILAMLGTLKTVGIIKTTQISIRANNGMADSKTRKKAGAPEGTPLRKYT